MSYACLRLYLHLARTCFADPTMTQTFFAHFSCRKVSEMLSVLRKDYDVECTGSSWWVLALMSTLGATVISVGFPIGMGLWMRRNMSKEMRKVRHEGKGRAAAYRDFRRKFSYVSVREHKQAANCNNDTVLPI